MPIPGVNKAIRSQSVAKGTCLGNESENHHHIFRLHITKDDFWSKGNIWHVNCVRATTFISDPRTDIPVKVSKFFRHSMSRPEGDSNLQPGIHTECFNHSSYQGQTFVVPCFLILALVVYTFLSKVSIWDTIRGQQHSFSTHERMFQEIRLFKIAGQRS